jgi:tripartite-type tricarboxylate transporter receptor subunit TctC
LSAQIAKILAMPDTIEALASLGMTPLISTPEQFAALMRSDTVRFAEVIKAGNVKAD